MADNQITAVTQEGDKLFAGLESGYSTGKPPPYDASSYDQVEGDLKALGTRLRVSGSDTESLAPISETALRQIEELRARHASGRLPTVPGDTYLVDKERLFNFNMGLLTSYELLLKAGASTGSAAQATSAMRAAGAKP